MTTVNDEERRGRKEIAEESLRTFNYGGHLLV